MSKTDTSGTRNQMTDTIAAARAELQRTMTARAGVLRSATSLDGADELIRRIAEVAVGNDVASLELANLCEVGIALIAAARQRNESRGSHTRIDHPDRLDRYCHRIVIGDAARPSHRLTAAT